MNFIFTIIFILLIPFLVFPIFIFFANLIAKLFLIKIKNNKCQKKLPSISILVPILNEERNILNKINNVLDLNYDLSQIELIFFSDGSTDQSVEILHKKMKENNSIDLRILQSEYNIGRALAHNALVHNCNKEIVIFTDCETSFNSDFVINIVKNFDDSNVGMVVGKLLFDSQNSIGLIEEIYFRFEAIYRKHLSDLGLLLTGTGAAMAIRRDSYVDLLAEEDIDDSLPLIIAQEGKKIVFSEESIATDVPVSDISSQFKARSRMSSKGLSAIIYRWKIRSIIFKPLQTLTLICHKILKWLTGFWIILLAVFIVVSDDASLITVKYSLFTLLIIYSMLLMLYLKFKQRFSFFESFISIPVAIFGSLWGTIIALRKKTKHGY